MKKRMAFLIFISVIATALTTLFIIAGVGFAMGFCTTYTNGRKYDSIEKLADDFIKSKNENCTWITDCFPKEYVYSLEIEDKCFAFFKYSETKDGEIKKDSLYVVVAEKEKNVYKLETPINGCGKWQVLYLNQDKSIKKVGYSGGQMFRVKINGEQRSICFLYKDVNENRKVLYNGCETLEMEMINPFTDESFILCYGVSLPSLFVNEKKFKAELK